MAEGLRGHEVQFVRRDLRPWEEFASFIKDDTTEWHDVITKAGVSLN
jgi:hypothetical protein